MYIRHLICNGTPLFQWNSAVKTQVVISWQVSIAILAMSKTSTTLAQSNERSSHSIVSVLSCFLVLCTLPFFILQDNCVRQAYIPLLHSLLYSLIQCVCIHTHTDLSFAQQTCHHSWYMRQNLRLYKVCMAFTRVCKEQSTCSTLVASNVR